MEIFIDNRSGSPFPESFEKLVKDVIRQTLLQEGLGNDVEISVSIVNNAEIQKINKKFRGIDKATDVLSFPMWEPDELEKGTGIACLALGDIVLSVDKALSQASEYGHSAEREIGFLIAHGTLHLLGYDHMNPDEDAQMNKKQDCILQSIGLTR